MRMTPHLGQQLELHSSHQSISSSSLGALDTPLFLCRSADSISRCLRPSCLSEPWILTSTIKRKRWLSYILYSSNSGPSTRKRRSRR